MKKRIHFSEFTFFVDAELKNNYLLFLNLLLLFLLAQGMSNYVNFKGCVFQRTNSTLRAKVRHPILILDLQTMLSSAETKSLIPWFVLCSFMSYL